MTKKTFHVLGLVGLSLAFGTLAFGEPAGIGEKGTGQTQKSTERQQSGNKPDLSQVPGELREGKSSEAARELRHDEQTMRGPVTEPSGIGEKGTGQTKKSTERQQTPNKPNLSQVPEELREGKTAQAAEEQLKHEGKSH
jgi:hypothetical protein